MKTKSNIEIIKKIDVTKYHWCNEAYIVSVKNGKSALKIKNLGYDVEWDMLSMLTLKNKPLIQSKLPQCPTCAGMLATGYGIDKDNPELKEISNAINSPFISLEKSIENIKPLLGLLSNGVYAIADIPSYPTDGEGNYFWAVSNKLKSVSTTVDTFLTEDFNAINSYPIYLYPSQSTENYNKERVNFYLKTASNKAAPRAIAYHIGGFISVLLDGHHKAAAAALSQNPINCITVMPITSFSLKNNTLLPKREFVNFSLFNISINDIPPLLRNTIKFKKIKKSYHKISEGTIIKNNWNDNYLISGNNFPTINELAEGISLDIKYDNINDEVISNCLSYINNDSVRKLRYIISVFIRTKDSRLLNLSLKCAKLKIDSQNCNIEMPMLNKLRSTAFNVLKDHKNNKEIEQFFIDFLIDSSNEKSELTSIANSYWKNQLTLN